MNLKVKIEDHSFKLSIGSGLNDWAWLSHYAARRFSKVSYPQGMYLPAQLYIVDKENQQIYPHPREKISLFLEQNKLSPDSITAVVKIRKGNHVLTNYEKGTPFVIAVWNNEAYGLERMMMTVSYLLETDRYRNKEGEKEFYFKVVFNNTIHKDIRHFFMDKKYAGPNEIELEEIRLGSESKTDRKSITTFKGHIKLPFGEANPELHYYWRDPKDPTSFRSQRVKQSDLRSDTFKVTIHTTPKYLSISQKNQLISQQMRISENITKSLQQKQLETNKRNISLSMCCYGFQQFWKLLEENYGSQLNLQKYDKSTRERLKIILEKSLNQLYKVFFYYFTIENQVRQKKQDFGVTYQSIMHFLRFYQIFKRDQPPRGPRRPQPPLRSHQPESRMLSQFLDLYNNGTRFTTISDTLDIEAKSINFVQFVCILLRAISFKQSQLTASKGETFDVAVAGVIERIIGVEAEEYLCSEVKQSIYQNIRKNPNMIEFIRGISPQLKKIYISLISKSIQLSLSSPQPPTSPQSQSLIPCQRQQKYMLTKQQLKLMLHTSSFTSQNIDTLINCLFSELELPEEGIYYYEFIEAVQYLATALVVSDRDQGVLESEEQETLLVMEKVKYFVEKMEVV